MTQRKHLLTLIPLLTLSIFGCQQSNSYSKQAKRNGAEIRKEITGIHFNNSDVISIDVIKIDLKNRNSIPDTFLLTNGQKNKLLNKLDKLQEKGIYKCMKTDFIHLNLTDDTLIIALCGSLVRVKNSDLYYELPNGKSLID